MMDGIANVTKPNGSYKLTVTGNIENVLKELSSHKLADISIHQMTLEDVFMHFYVREK